MAIIKCKMCGGDLTLTEGQSVAECEYCGSKQTVPTADNEKKLTLFARANRLRAACDFDKAAGLYEAIVAEFPEEAESYWGLVLCKYGIEYVNDPATGKKIPTCHRSSFDSVMDDGNFEQAMENADEAALRVYRQEAKQIEEIRKGILAVSSSEKPYDIFICYKETDAEGDRTVDSLLAQDIYDSLTSKGYRVFFSRITLEDKLGQAYEPYIFAALNSAKIMLAVGTCYEHYNAVWVKNEWSRYLKIIAQDKNKYLIPCYKGLDAYDMPKEFAHLQGQDMGKVGAIADLLRGIEKLMPKQESNTTVIQERVVVGGSGGSNKIASLLDRGNMALEDGDWAKADSFFEDVLNNDSKNAQAYIGKTLAQERCRTMDALVRKRKDVYQSVRAETLYIKERVAHIHDAAERFSLPGYVEEGDIRKLYDFERGYSSEVAGRQKQYREEENWWQNHKQLSRAEKFAVGAVAEHLQNEKKHLFAQLNERVKKAQEAEARAVSKLEGQYDAHIAQADKKAEEIYEEGSARREEDYKKWLEKAKHETDPATLKTLAGCFDKLRDYQDSRNLAEHCRKRAAEEQARIEAEKARKAEEARQRAAVQAKRNKKNAIIVALFVCVFIAFVAYMNNVIIPVDEYESALTLEKAGKTAEAAIAFGKAGDYEDAREQAFRLWNETTQRDTLSAGGQHTVGLKADGTVVAVGNNEDGRCNVSDWRDIVAISAGDEHTVGLKADGSVVAVGDNEDGQCDVDRWTDIVSISAGNEHTVGLKVNGRVVAVGSNFYGQREVTGWRDIVAISAGDFHTVGLKADGSVVAVGDNYYGQCDVSDWTDIIAISARRYHTVGLKADGTVVAVGSNYYGQCFVSAWTDIIAISAGFSHTVGLKTDGTVVEAGYNWNGECEVSGWTDIAAISAGDGNTVGLSADGSVVAVGYNGNGECNAKDWTDIKMAAISAEQQAAMERAKAAEEERIAAERKAEEERLAKEYAAAEALANHGEKGKAAIAYTKLGDYGDAKERSRQLWSEAAQRDTVSAGDCHTVGLKADGTVVAVGSNEDGQCNISGWTDIVAISAGAYHTVGLKADGTVVAAGYNEDGRCDVSGWKDIIAVSAGDYHTVGLKADGSVVAVGSNGHDQCEVSDWTDIVAVSTGPYHTVGLKADGTVVAVGYNEYGQCEVSDWTNIVAVSAGVFHTVGLKADGTVVATEYIGEYYGGQCDVSGWSGIVAISAGWNTLGLKADGTVVSTEPLNKNVAKGQHEVNGWRNIVAVDTTDYHTVGLKADGTVVAVGINTDGRCDVSSWKNIKLPQ